MSEANVHCYLKGSLPASGLTSEVGLSQELLCNSCCYSQNLSPVLPSGGTQPCLLMFGHSPMSQRLIQPWELHAIPTACVLHN